MNARLSSDPAPDASRAAPSGHADAERVVPPCATAPIPPTAVAVAPLPVVAPLAAVTALPVDMPSHLVLIPSFNTGPTLLTTVEAALAHWPVVWVVIDGSTDVSARLLDPLLDPASERYRPELRRFEFQRNRGKGAAVLAGLCAALQAGFTHALTMDADGQHPAALIPTFMAASRAAPRAMILGRPVFDADAPQLRVQGRRISNWWANLETFGEGIGDSLYGFRVYPISPLVQIMLGQRRMRRFDFDVEAAVRLCWHGVHPVNIDAPVRYLSEAEGGVSHFRYVRDNALLTWMHARLFAGYLLRRLIRARARGD